MKPEDKPQIIIGALVRAVATEANRESAEKFRSVALDMCRSFTRDWNEIAGAIWLDGMIQQERERLSKLFTEEVIRREKATHEN